MEGMCLSKEKRILPKLSGWQWFNCISLLLIALAIWGAVVSSQGISGLFSRLASLDLRWMALAAACMIAYWVLEACALNWLISCLYQGASFLANVRTAMIGQLYSALTPFSSGGQPVQLMYMHRDGMDTGGGASVLVVKSVLYQVGIILMAFLPLMTSYHLFSARVPAFGWLAALGFGSNLIVTAGMILLAIYPLATRRLYSFCVKVLHAFRIVRDADATIAKAQIQFDIYRESTLRYEKKRAVLGGVIAVTLVQLSLLYLVPYTIYRAFGLHEPGILVHTVAAVAFVSMVSAFVPLPGGSGGAEGTFLLFFAKFFPEDLLVAMLLWRLITYYAGMVVGTSIMLISRKRQRSVVRLSS